MFVSFSPDADEEQHELSLCSFVHLNPSFSKK